MSDFFSIVDFCRTSKRVNLIFLIIWIHFWILMYLKVVYLGENIILFVCWLFFFCHRISLMNILYRFVPQKKTALISCLCFLMLRLCYFGSWSLFSFSSVARERRKNVFARLIAIHLSPITCLSFLHKSSDFTCFLYHE